MFSRCHAVPPRLALGVLGVGSVTSPPLQPHVCMGIFVHGEIFSFPPEKCQCLLVAICQPLQIATVPGSAQVCPEARYGPVLALLCKAWSSRFSIGNAQVSVWVASSKNQRVFLCAWATFQDASIATAKCCGHRWCWDGGLQPDTLVVLRAQLAVGSLSPFFPLLILTPAGRVSRTRARSMGFVPLRGPAASIRAQHPPGRSSAALCSSCSRDAVCPS